jgi:hypothetical protein
MRHLSENGSISRRVAHVNANQPCRISWGKGVAPLKIWSVNFFQQPSISVEGAMIGAFGPSKDWHSLRLQTAGVPNPLWGCAKNSEEVHKPKLVQVPIPLSLHRVCPKCGRACDQSRVDSFSMQINGLCFCCAHPQQKVVPTIRRH